MILGLGSRALGLGGFSLSMDMSCWGSTCSYKWGYKYGSFKGIYRVIGFRVVISRVKVP